MQRCLLLPAAILLVACSTKTKKNPDAAASAKVVSTPAEPSSSAELSRQLANATPFCAPGAVGTWARQFELEGAVDVTTDGADLPLLQVNGQQGAINLVKLDSNGSTVWSQSFEANGRLPMPLLLATNRQGSSVVISKAAQVEGRLVPFAALLDGAGKVLWKREPVKSKLYWDTMAVAIDAQGKAIALGIADSPVDLGQGPLGGHKRHAFVFKLDAQGTPVWSMALGGLIDTPKIGGFSDGSVLLTGTLYDSLKVGKIQLSSTSKAPFIAKLSSKGEVVFARVLATEQPSVIHDLAVSDDGSFYLGLAFSSTLDLGSQSIHTKEARSKVIVKLDAAGEVVWSKILGPSPIELSLAAAADQSVVVATAFRDRVTLDDRNLEGGVWSNVVTKLDRRGKVDWLYQWPGTAEASPSVAVSRCGAFVGAKFKKVYETGQEVIHREKPVAATAAVLLHIPGRP
ncbi:MAG TPA: hypothetical protein VJN18_22475 [Polyangiaceae bacterium]|nr:hypothetical protein [Polyangiaceae bacterium]